MANGNRLKWLRVRAEYIHEMAAEGRSFAEIARALSCDPGQAQLIAMTPLDTLHPGVSDSAIASAAELRGMMAERERCLGLLRVLRAESRLFDADTYQIVFSAFQKGVSDGHCTRVLMAIQAERSNPFWAMSPGERAMLWDEQPGEERR